MPTYSGTQKNRPQHNSSASGNAWADNNAVVVGAALTTADAIVALEIPAGVELTTVRFRNGDLDTGTGVLAVNIGYRSRMAGGSLAAAPTYFAAASAALAAPNAGWQELVFPAIKFNEAAEIVVVPTVGANALGAAATLFVQGGGQVIGVA